MTSTLLALFLFPLLIPGFPSLSSSSDSSLFISAAANPSDGEAPFVGVVIGDGVSGFLPPEDLARFLLSQRITHVRLSNPSRSLLAALNSTGVRVLVTVPNSLLVAFASSPSSASSWTSRLILPFVHSISAIAVGDDFSPSASASTLLPALRSLSSAMSGLPSRIPISAPLPFSIIQEPFPPSQAFFNRTLTPTFLLPLLAFLSSTASPFMLNLYPYYSFMRSRGVIPLDSALLKPLPPSQQEVDPNTLLHYTNLFDAMLDAARFALRSLNFSHIPIVVTETGWPSAGDPKAEPYATKDNAAVYNSNLIKHVLVDRAGTPLAPEQTASVYIYELFNEDLRPGPESEKHWGLFYGDGTPVYLLNVAGSGGFLAGDSANRTFCVAAEVADGKTLQAALDWACGPGKANCSEIQPGQDCYDPNDVRRHASYAFDSYYQKERKVAGSCYFQGVAMVTTTDPSHGDCIFPGRSIIWDACPPLYFSKQVNDFAKAGRNTTIQSSESEESCCWRHIRRGKMREGHCKFSVLRTVIAVLFVNFFLRFLSL